MFSGPFFRGIEVKTAYAVGPDGTAPGDYLKVQDDGHRITRTTFPPPEYLVREMMYDDDLVQARGRHDNVGLRDDSPHRAVNNFDGSGKSEKDVFTDYIKALGIHITTEIASKCSGTSINRFHKEVLLVVPNNWSGSLQNTILQVGSSLL